MIKMENGVFYLETDHTAYAFRLLENGYLQHLYYGSKEDCTFEKTFRSRNANVRYSKAYPYCLENIRLECSFTGKGDVREPLAVVTYADGSFTGDFVYQSHKVSKGKRTLDTLPSDYGASGGTRFDLGILCYFPQNWASDNTDASNENGKRC